MTASHEVGTLQGGALTPDQRRKIRAIEQALGSRDRKIRDHLISIDTFDRSARKAKNGRVWPEWPRRIDGLRFETLAARDRLDGLNTGLRAQGTLRSALTELASAFDAWNRGLTSSDIAVVEQAMRSMQRHYLNAGRLGKTGLAELKAGR